jgi:hypothetical protein
VPEIGWTIAIEIERDPAFFESSKPPQHIGTENPVIVRFMGKHMTNANKFSAFDELVQRSVDRLRFGQWDPTHESTNHFLLGGDRLHIVAV